MDTINHWLNEHNITEVECLVPDMTGNARGKFVPADKFYKEETRLPESILLQSVTGGYPDEYDDILGVTDSDMFLRPDPGAMRLVPWAKDPTAQIIHDCVTRDGELHPLSSRGVLKRVLSLYEQEGWKPVVAPEVEFYLVQQATDPDSELRAPAGRSGRAEVMRRSYTIDAINEFDPLIEDMFDYCEAMGLDVDSLIDETGAAQMELNFLHGDALNLADQVFTFKRTLRETAMQHGVFATFMAKPMEKEPGSSMHIHQSIVDANTGKNIFVDGAGNENQLFRHYIGGLQKFTKHAMPFYAPNVNSYRRFTRDIAAPINLNWGYDNRTTGIRVPDSSPQAKRVENRFAGVDVNPYLAFAATLASGFLGMKLQIEPSAPCEGNSYDEDIEVARTLEHAARLLDECQELRDILGNTFVDAYVAVKASEYEEFNKVISSWEREHLLLNV
ncbi:glutamine synthetase [Pseudomaricurvus alkylphenolicus]|jgi:glutamine synthetase|uniref:glutamine synthetase family protein n=1 Tax=Pseudomaricurvus alkylphenolicus TaxID=1306991 RepID=UPI001421EB4E|nr:glutamine synthetase family protein [Pseudomaricurvus alkylphenolicus]NIB39432.1 glutamine synthetase [Pseudomaricurvus alkylphenolicus]